MLRSLNAGGRGGAVVPPAALVRRHRAWTDAAFRAALTAVALLVIVLVAWMVVQLVIAAMPAIRRFGAAFLWTRRWDPVHEIFGAVTFAYGTAASSLLALLLAVPVSLGAAVYLAEIAPRAVFTTLSFVIELLASIPSVILGLWGVFVMAPWLRRVVEPALAGAFGRLPLFSGPAYGFGLLAGGVILAIMLLPTTSSVSREVVRAAPQSQRAAAAALR